MLYSTAIVVCGDTGGGGDGDGGAAGAGGNGAFGGGGGSAFGGVDPNQTGSCLYLNDEGTGITPGVPNGGGVDPNSTYGGCTQTGGVFSPSTITGFAFTDDSNAVELFSTTGISLGIPYAGSEFFTSDQVLADAPAFVNFVDELGTFGAATFNKNSFTGCFLSNFQNTYSPGTSLWGTAGAGGIVYALPGALGAIGGGLWQLGGAFTSGADCLLGLQ